MTREQGAAPVTLALEGDRWRVRDRKGNAMASWDLAEREKAVGFAARLNGTGNAAADEILERALTGDQKARLEAVLAERRSAQATEGNVWDEAREKVVIDGIRAGRKIAEIARDDLGISHTAVYLRRKKSPAFDAALVEARRNAAEARGEEPSPVPVLAKPREGSPRMPIEPPPAAPSPAPAPAPTIRKQPAPQPVVKPAVPNSLAGLFCLVRIELDAVEREPATKARADGAARMASLARAAAEIAEREACKS